MSPISSIQLHQQMCWRAVRCPPINTLHAYRDAGGRCWPGSSWPHCSHHPQQPASDVFPFYMLSSLPLVSSSGAQGREKR